MWRHIQPGPFGKCKRKATLYRSSATPGSRPPASVQWPLSRRAAQKAGTRRPTQIRRHAIDSLSACICAYLRQKNTCFDRSIANGRRVSASNATAMRNGQTTIDHFPNFIYN
jgi:hypothetical protein